MAYLVKDVLDVEAVRILLSEAVKLLAEKDILLLDVAEYELHISLVSRVVEDAFGHLQHGGNSRAASDKVSLTDGVGLVLVLGRGSLDLHRVANLKLGELLGEVAIRVALHKEVQHAALVCVDRGVRAGHGLVTDGGTKGSTIERQNVRHGKSDSEVSE